MNNTDYNDEMKQTEDVEETHSTIACPSCGSSMEYDSATQMLKCIHCGTTQEIEDNFEDIIEHCFMSLVEKVDNNWSNEPTSVKCENCGGTTNIDASNLSIICPYCDSPIVKDEQYVNGMMPGALIPFKITEDDVIKMYENWIKRKKLAPRDLRKKKKLTHMRGRYVPYFTFDAQTESNYTAQRGDYYYVTVRTKNGTRRVRHTRWTRVSGFYSEFYDDALVNASKLFNAKLVDRIHPFDAKELYVYKPKYVAGYLAETHRIKLGDAFVEAKQIMHDEIIRGVKRQIGGDVVRNVVCKTNYYDISTKHILLPIYVAKYTYKQKEYQFLVNGQTGRIYGKAPISAIKIALIVLSVIILLIIFGVIASFTGGGA